MGKELTVDTLLDDAEYEKSVETLSFEEGVTLLEDLVEQVEAGDLPLERSILAYERGVGLLGHLRGLISGAEEKLETLQKKAASKAKGKKKKP